MNKPLLMECHVVAHVFGQAVAVSPKRPAFPGAPWRLLGMLFVVLFGTTTTLCAQAQPDIPALIQICSGCHGATGVSATQEIPSLAGQNETYLLKRLIALKTQQTPSEVMKAMTHAVSDEDLKLLARFFARQPYVRNLQSIDMEKSARGRKVYGRVCNLCHIEEGRATVYPEYPLLAGQSLNYMLNELDHMLSRKRGVEILKIGTLASVPREDVEDAIHFFASQQVSPDQIKNNVNEPSRASRRYRKID